MAFYGLWIFITLCPFLAHSESGDDALPDTESSSVFCSSIISLTDNKLICDLHDEDDIEAFAYATLCGDKMPAETCINGTLKDDSITFQNLEILKLYQLQTFFKEGASQKQYINLVKIVKLPTPVVNNASYNSDEAHIYIGCKHDYVERPKFEVEIWGSSDVNRLSIIAENQPVSIGGNRLSKNDIYHVRVRAKPMNYFDGSWSEWSQVKSFRRSAADNVPDPNPSPLTYIFICTFIIVVIVIGLVLPFKKEIKDCITPNIPNPKATLAQIHREKERPPVSFSPEIFNDVNINQVDYAEEKQLTEPDDGHEDTTGTCPSEPVGSRPASLHKKQDGDDTRLEEEMSHLKIKLLDEPEEGQREDGCRSLATLQRDCKDETYVTMSSLYKTQ